MRINPLSDPLDVFVTRAYEYAASGRLDNEEVNYKLRIGHTLAQAREAVLDEANHWQPLVKRGISVNLVFRIQQIRLRDWIDRSPGEALLAFQALWTPEDASPLERIRKFCRLLPRPVTSGLGSRASLAAVLMMGLDAEQLAGDLIVEHQHTGSPSLTQYTTYLITQGRTERPTRPPHMSTPSFSWTACWKSVPNEA